MLIADYSSRHFTGLWSLGVTFSFGFRPFSSITYNPTFPAPWCRDSSAWEAEHGGIHPVFSVIPLGTPRESGEALWLTVLNERGMTLHVQVFGVWYAKGLPVIFVCLPQVSESTQHGHGRYEWEERSGMNGLRVISTLY